ncbi:MAG: DUF4358 domain-containing protein [Oribacterium sp.]|nr:DUF4358 domain-containing protein [Oribacterium sp.]MDY2855241.1 DUF4358 domain-containing protein [Oliverpabstia sp.]
MKKRFMTVAMLAASMLVLNACGSGNAEAVTTAAVTSAAAETTTATEETTTAAETAVAEETTTAVEETTAAAEESKDEKESAEAESKDEKAVKDETKADEKNEAAAQDAKAEETTATETKAASTGAAPADIYSKLTSYLPSMVSFDDSYISNYYGIDASQLDGYVFAAAEDVTQADTVVILKAKDASSVSTLSSQLATVKQQKEAELQDYNPTAYQVAAAGFVKTSGNYVYLIMSGNASQIDQVISANVG